MIDFTNSYPYPFLEEDRYDYLDNIKYEVNQIDGTREYITFEHKIRGDSLISQLLKRNEAKFVTTAVLKSLFIIRKKLFGLEGLRKKGFTRNYFHWFKPGKRFPIKNQKILGNYQRFIFFIIGIILGGRN